MPPDSESNGNPLAQDHDEVLDGLALTDQIVVSAGWTEGLRDFDLDLADGRTVRFHDALQVSFTHPIGPPDPPRIAGWWTDEPSPLLGTLGPEVRFLFHHLVFDLGESLLRVAFRDLELVTPASPI